MVRQLIRSILESFGLQITRTSSNANESVGKIGFLQHKGRRRGNALLSYIVEPFLLQDEADISNAHHHDWLSWQIGQTFSSFGYDVDVIHYLDDKFVPKKPYDFFVGARTNFQRLSELLPPQCIKIVHLDTAHWLFNNSAAYKRHLELQQRRGVTLNSFKMIEANWALEYADYATTNWGNQFNVGTYQYAKKPIFQIPLPTCATYPKPQNKDFSASSNHYLWFGSEGLVHKGLDLVLEAFVQMPEYQLTVCGPIRKKGQEGNCGPFWIDDRFEEVFHQELYESPNILTEGWVDIEGGAFQKAIDGCIGVIFPSCSEGGAASVITCMQAGLIPIVSYETNVEVADFGFTLPDCSVHEIKKAVQEVGSLPEKQLKARAFKTWQFCRTHHTRDKFAENYRRVIEQIMTERNVETNCRAGGMRQAPKKG